MTPYEATYAKIVHAVLTYGHLRPTRNEYTRSIVGTVIAVDCEDFPILQGRKMFPEGIFGELAAFVRGPKHLKDFEEFGCNYWAKWAKPDGSINVDYGNAWLAGEQLDFVHQCLISDPYNRRMLITGWRPERLHELDLPCCHFAYQFYVREQGGDSYLDMMWTQRSTDVMIGLPSDVLLGWAMIQALAAFANLKPGVLTMSLGDTHIYEPHFTAAREYLERLPALNNMAKPTAEFNREAYVGILSAGLNGFLPEHVLITSYEHLPSLKLGVIA